MQAAQITKFGGPEVLVVREVQVPSRAPGEVLVKVMATSINLIDVKSRAITTGHVLEGFLNFLEEHVERTGSAAVTREHDTMHVLWSREQWGETKM